MFSRVGQKLSSVMASRRTLSPERAGRLARAFVGARDHQRERGAEVERAIKNVRCAQFFYLFFNEAVAVPESRKQELEVHIIP